MATPYHDLEAPFQAAQAAAAKWDDIGFDRSATVYSLAMLAYAAGESYAGDAVYSELDDALFDDGHALDSLTAAKEELASAYPDVRAWMQRVLTAVEVQKIAERKAAAKARGFAAGGQG